MDKCGSGLDDLMRLLLNSFQYRIAAVCLCSKIFGFLLDLMIILKMSE